MDRPPGNYVVVITTQRTGVEDGYAAAAERMAALAEEMPGFRGMDTVRGDDGAGISVSYWDSLGALRAWREHSEHLVVQQSGREHWYEQYQVTVGKIERVSEWQREPADGANSP